MIYVVSVIAVVNTCALVLAVRGFWRDVMGR